MSMSKRTHVQNHAYAIKTRCTPIVENPEGDLKIAISSSSYENNMLKISH